MQRAAIRWEGEERGLPRRLTARLRSCRWYRETATLQHSGVTVAVQTVNAWGGAPVTSSTSEKRVAHCALSYSNRMSQMGARPNGLLLEPETALNAAAAAGAGAPCAMGSQSPDSAPPAMLLPLGEGWNRRTSSSLERREKPKPIPTATVTTTAGVKVCLDYRRFFPGGCTVAPLWPLK